MRKRTWKQSISNCWKKNKKILFWGVYLRRSRREDVQRMQLVGMPVEGSKKVRQLRQKYSILHDQVCCRIQVIWHKSGFVITRNKRAIPKKEKKKSGSFLRLDTLMNVESAIINNPGRAFFLLSKNWLSERQMLTNCQKGPNSGALFSFTPRHAWSPIFWGNK